MARATKKVTLSPNGYVGKEKLTIARRANGTQVYVWRGQNVPADIPEDEVLRLAQGGYIEPKDAPAGAGNPRQTKRAATTPATPPATGDEGDVDEGDGDGDA